MRTSRSPRRLLIVFAWVCIAFVADAQRGPAVAPFQGQFRDAVIDRGANTAYLAAYDRNEIVRVNLDTVAITGALEVGRGPAFLALSSDGRTLAVVNRLDNSVSLVDVERFAIVASPLTGDGPSGVAALPGGGFAVSNAFSDTLTLVAPDGSTRNVDTPASVPVAIAASASAVAVAAREPATLMVFRNDFSSVGSIPLPGVPKAVATLDGDRFAVALGDALVIVDAADKRISASRSMTATGVAVSDDRVFVASGDRVAVLDHDLAPIEEHPIATPVWAIAHGNGITLAASPVARTLYSWGSPGGPVAVAQTPPETPGPVAPETREPAPAPAAPPAPSVEEPSIIEAQPLPKAVAETPPESPETEPQSTPSPAPPAPVPAADGPAAPDEGSVETPRDKALRESRYAARRPSPIPLGPSAPRAPRLGPPSRGVASGQTLSEALAEGTVATPTEEGFQPPEWAGEIQDITAGTLASQGEDEYVGTDGVSFRLDRTHVSSRDARIVKSTGEIEVTGDVRITQGTSSLTADRIFFKPPPPEEEERMPRLLVVEDESERARQRLSLGRFEADNLELIEPSRELTADRIEFDMLTQQGSMENAEGRMGDLLFGARKIRVLGPAEAEGEDVWVTTCDRDPPHYRVRVSKVMVSEGKVLLGKNARLQLGKADTPLYLPQFRGGGGGKNRRTDYDYDSGRLAELGYYLNVARWVEVSPGVDAGLRLFPTQREGIGFGVDLDYDFMSRPTSPLFRGKGSLQTLYTTEDRGYTQFYHRQELDKQTVVLVQAEQWFDRDFVKDFYYETYRDRTGPRSFVNLTRTQPRQILTLTAAPSTHDFTRETEKLPEFTYHLIERPIGERLYFTFDSVDGYYDRSRGTDGAARSVNVARLTLDWDINQAVSVTPFIEADGSWYSDTREDDGDQFRVSGTAGLTLQTRLHRAYAGRWGFSGFKHILLPSLTYSYRPDGSLESEDVPQFDPLDARPGRSRIETKIDNLFLGRDAESGEEWQVARISFYTGNDFENEVRKSQDYELEFDIRPRPWWGFQAVGEHHGIDNTDDPLRHLPYLREARRFWEDVLEREVDDDWIGPRSGDFDRVRGYVYYDDVPHGGNLNGLIGFAYTNTDNRVYNREALYGLGFKMGDNWSASFEHRYDFKRGELARQSYELRHRLHCWETSFKFTDRESGWDIGVEFSLSAFPGAKVKF